MIRIPLTAEQMRRTTPHKEVLINRILFTLCTDMENEAAKLGYTSYVAKITPLMQQLKVVDDIVEALRDHGYAVKVVDDIDEERNITTLHIDWSLK